LNKTAGKILLKLTIAPVLLLIAGGYGCRSPQPEADTIKYSSGRQPQFQPQGDYHDTWLEFEGTNLPSGLCRQESAVSLSSKHRIRGNQALRWDWKTGSVLRLERNIPWTADEKIDSFTYNSIFKFWIYNEQPNSNAVLRFSFGKDGKECCSFPFKLNFSGWRTAWVSYAHDMSGTPLEDMDYMQIEAPDGHGSFLIDDLALNLRIDIRHRAADRQTPFINSTKYSLENIVPHEANILVDAKVKPDAAGTALTSEDLVTFREIEHRLHKQYPPAHCRPEQIEQAFSQYNITMDSDGTIRGNHIIHLGSKAGQAGFPPELLKQITQPRIHDFRAFTELMLKVARSYRFQVQNAPDSAETIRLKEIFLLMSKHLLDQGWQAGSAQGAMHHFGYSSRSWPPAIFLMRNELEEAGMLEPMSRAMIWYLNIKKHFLPTQLSYSNMDYMNTCLFPELLVLCSLPDSSEKTLWLKTYSRSVSRITAAKTPGTMCGIKTDGSIFHHHMHYYGYGMPAMERVASLIETLDGTDYEISAEAYNNIKHVILQARLWGCPWSGFNACGRHPLLSSSIDISNITKTLALSAPQTDGFDPKLAKAWLTIKPTGDNNPFTAEIKADNPQGFWAMNYQACGVYKHGESTVLMKGYGNGVRSHETYKKDNRYGRYSSHGTIQIFKNSREHRSGFENRGWGWSQPPGATTLILPLDILEGGSSFYGHGPKQLASFAGAAHLENRFGLFAFRLDPRQSAEQALQMRKSVIAVDDMLICLGSGISNSSTKYPTVTTLFQTGLTDGFTSVKTSKDESITIPYSNVWNSAAKAPAWIIDPYGTGFCTLSDGKIHLQMQKQISRHNKTKQPTEGDFAMAWIDHGTNPQNAAYLYVSILNADSNRMQAISAKISSDSPPFKVLQQTEDIHAVYIPSEKLLTITAFKPITNRIKAILSSDKPCLILARQPKADRLTISITDPVLNLTKTATAPPTDITLNLAGKWEAATKTAGHITINSKRTNTVITAACSDGIPSTIHLIKLKQ